MLSVLWLAPTIVAGGLSFTMPSIRDSMSPMDVLSTECDDAPQSEVMINFSGPGGAEPVSEGECQNVYVGGFNVHLDLRELLP